MTEHNRQFDDPEPHVSDRLRQDLQGLFQPPGAVPARIDKTILDQMHRHIAKPRHLIVRLRWTGAVAAAAVIVLGVILYNAPTPNNQQSNIRNQKSSRLALAEGRADVDGNGRVDILDAFRLARNIEARDPAAPTPGGAVDLRWDLNADGRVDKGDVDTVALAAVHLGSDLRGEGIGTPNAKDRVWEPGPPLRREAILASLFSTHSAPVTSDMQGQDALATNPSGSPRDNGV